MLSNNMRLLRVACAPDSSDVRAVWGGRDACGVREKRRRKKGWIRIAACVFVYNVLQITSRECVARVYLFYTKIVFIIFKRVSVLSVPRAASQRLTPSRAPNMGMQLSQRRRFEYFLRRTIAEHVERVLFRLSSFCVRECIELIRYKLSCSRQQRQQNTETMMIFGAAAKQSWPFCIRNSQRLFHVYCEIVCCTRARVSMAVLTAINGARESSRVCFECGGMG